jgi:hypothetical protein
MKQQILPEAMEYVWKGYPIEGAKGARNAAGAESPAK